VSSEQPQVTRLGGDPPSPYEGMFGYNRMVVAGPWVLIGGTTSVDPSGYVVGTTPYEQTMEILRKLLHELSRVGFTADDVVQTRMYVTDISRCDEVGRAHGEAFGDAGPVTSMVEVSGLIDPRMLVEIELVAYRT
jgi:enamine deaminase RidA (YjgF/YER057c/UK114 family)